MTLTNSRVFWSSISFSAYLLYAVKIFEVVIVPNGFISSSINSGNFSYWPKRGPGAIRSSSSITCSMSDSNASTSAPSSPTSSKLLLKDSNWRPSCKRLRKNAVYRNWNTRKKLNFFLISLKCCNTSKKRVFLGKTTLVLQLRVMIYIEKQLLDCQLPSQLYLRSSLYSLSSILSSV